MLKKFSIKRKLKFTTLNKYNKVYKLRNTTQKNIVIEMQLLLQKFETIKISTIIV